MDNYHLKASFQGKCRSRRPGVRFLDEKVPERDCVWDDWGVFGTTALLLSPTRIYRLGMQLALTSWQRRITTYMEFGAVILGTACAEAHPCALWGYMGGGC